MFSKNLKYYRLKAGLSKASLAQASGLSSMAITHYEAGSRKPNMDSLLALTDALDVSLADLLRRRNSTLTFEHGDFRKSSNMSVAAQDFVRESVEEYFGRFYDVLECLGGEVLPNAPECGLVPLSADVEADAAEMRRWLAIEPVGPVPDLVGVLENRGILFMALEGADARFSGMNGIVNGRPYIVVNASMSPERNRSTIAHELAHLLFSWGDVKGKEQENYATAVSGAFLLSAADAVRELGIRRRAVTRDMEMVAREYGVSMMLLSKRANLAGIVSDSAYRSFCIAASKKGWRTEEPSRIDTEKPELFKQLVYRAVCEDDMSVLRGAELLGVSFDEVTYQCELIGA